MRMMKWGAALLLLILAGCSAAPQHEDEAAAMVNKLYAALQQQHWNAALDMYGKQFYAGHQRDAWARQLKSIQQKLGPMQGRQLIFKRKDPRFHYDVYIFSYRVAFARGESTDVVTVYQDVSGGDLAIVGHKITLKAGG